MARVSPLSYVAIAVIVLVIVAVALLWWQALTPSRGPRQTGVTNKQPAEKTVPSPVVVPPPQQPAKAAPPKQPATKSGAPASVEKAKPAPPPTKAIPETPLPPAGKVTLEVPPVELKLEPGQTINPELGTKIQAIVSAQARQFVDVTAGGVKPVPKGTALKATVDGVTYEGTAFRDFNAYVSPEGAVTLKRFYVKTTNQWVLDKQSAIPAGTELQFGEDSRYAVAAPEKPPAPPPPVAPPQVAPKPPEGVEELKPN
jgi:cytoskeletal protein RodZ